jgi:hypothetical protein
MARDENNPIVAGITSLLGRPRSTAHTQPRG